MPSHSERVRRNYVSEPLTPDTNQCGLDVTMALIVGGIAGVVLTMMCLL